MARAPAGIDLENLSDAQLRELMQHVKETLAKRVTQRIDEFRMLARDAGFEISLTKLGEGTPGRKHGRAEHGGWEASARREVAMKYQNPDNPAEQWSGRGRKPKWVEEKLSAGRQLPDLLIDGTKEAA